MALLFGGNSSGRNQPKNLVEFRAGKMSLKGNLVSPDKRKGLVYIYESEDGLRHFCWKDRKSGTVEDDLIVFPDDIEFKKVSQAKPGSRVFLLKFKASARKLFFWMQEPKSDGDDDLAWKVNDTLNNQSGGSNGGRLGQSGNATPTPSEQDVQALLSQMSQSQLMQLIGGMSDLGGASGLLAQLSQMAPGASASGGSGGGGSGETKAATTTSSSSSKPATVKTEPAEPKPDSASSSSQSQATPIQLQDLKKILSNIQPSTQDLAAGINSDFIQRITSCPSTVQKLAPLLPNFGGPEVAANPDGVQKDVEKELLTPQFQNALSAFCSAFPSGQLGPLVSQFAMGTDAINAAQSGNLEAFLNAIQKDVDKNSTTQDIPDTATSTTPADEPEDMNVD